MAQKENHMRDIINKFKEKKVTAQKLNEMQEGQYILIFKEIKSADITFQINLELLGQKDILAIDPPYSLEDLKNQLPQITYKPLYHRVVCLNPAYNDFFADMFKEMFMPIPTHDISVLIKEIDVPKLNLITTEQGFDLLHNLAIHHNTKCFKEVISGSVLYKEKYMDKYSLENLQRDVNELFRTACSFNALEIVKFLTQSDCLTLKVNQAGLLYGLEWAQMKENTQITDYLENLESLSISA